MSDVVRLKPEDKFRELDFLLDVATWEDHGDYPRHVHDFSKIAIVMQGSGTVDIDGQMLPFRKGDVFVMHGNRSNAWVDTQNLTMTNVLFSEKLIDLNRFESGLLPGYQALFVIAPALREEKSFQRHLRLSVDQLISVKTVIDIMEKELAEKKPGYRMMAVGHFMVLIVLLSRYYTDSEESGSPHAIQMGKALSYLEEHYLEEVDICLLAKLAGMSTRSFFRLFPKITGDTPKAYLNKLRMVKAVELLEFSDKSVTEIAYDCGFQDSNYFSRHFKKVMGATPSEFRRMLKRSN